MKAIARASLHVALLLFGVTASAEPSQEMKNVLREVSEELTICQAYFTVVSACTDNSSPELAAKYLQEADSLNYPIAVMSVGAGLILEAITARQKLAGDSLMAEIHRDCGNIAVLVVKYGDTCKKLSLAPTERVKELLSEGRQ